MTSHHVLERQFGDHFATFDEQTLRKVTPRTIAARQTCDELIDAGSRRMAGDQRPRAARQPSVRHDSIDPSAIVPEAVEWREISPHVRRKPSPGCSMM